MTDQQTIEVCPLTPTPRPSIWTAIRLRGALGLNGSPAMLVVHERSGDVWTDRFIPMDDAQAHAVLSRITEGGAR